MFIRFKPGSEIWAVFQVSDKIGEEFISEGMAEKSPFSDDEKVFQNKDTAVVPAVFYRRSKKEPVVPKASGELPHLRN